MVGWHHRLDGREFEQTPGDSEGQGSLAWSQRVGHDWATRLNASVRKKELEKEQISEISQSIFRERYQYRQWDDRRNNPSVLPFIYWCTCLNDPLSHLSPTTTISGRRVSVIIHFTDKETNSEMSCNLLKVSQRSQSSFLPVHLGDKKWAGYNKAGLKDTVKEKYKISSV